MAAVEFALIAPILLTLFGAAVDLGRAIERSIRLEAAARTALLYVQLQPAASGSAIALAQSAISDVPSATVNISSSCTCPTDSTMTAYTAATCGTACTSGMVQYVTITVSAPFTQFFPLSTYLPFNSIGATTRTIVGETS